MEITLDEAINNYPKLIGELTYSCYKYNREIAPNTTPEQWKRIFSNVDTMEKRLQDEIAKGGG